MPQKDVQMIQDMLLGANADPGQPKPLFRNPAQTPGSFEPGEFGMARGQDLQKLQIEPLRMALGQQGLHIGRKTHGERAEM